MPSTKRNAQRSPLHERQRAQGARFVELAGWQIVDYFTSPDEEYTALRHAAAFADLCHQGRLKVTGHDAVAVLNELVTINIADMEENTEEVCYLLNDRGGIIDEVGIFRSDKFCTVHCSSLMKDRVHAWLEENGRVREDFQIADASGSQGSIDVRGPAAEALLREALLDGQLPEVEKTSAIAQIGQARCLVVKKKLGSTDGYRIDTGSLFLQAVWDRLTTVGAGHGAVPAGWRACEILRLEAGIPGAGAEIDEHTTPFEIGAALRVQLSKGYFMGRRPLLHSTAAEFQRRLVHLQFQADTPPVPGDAIELDGIPVGYVTSSAVSPRLQAAIAMGFVDAMKSTRGTMVDVRVQGEQVLRAIIADPVEMQAAT